MNTECAYDMKYNKSLVHSEARLDIQHMSEIIHKIRDLVCLVWFRTGRP